MWKKRFSLMMVTVLILSVFALAGCNSEETAKDDPAPAPAPAEKVDEAAIVYQAARDYFDYLPDGVMVKPDAVKDKVGDFFVVDMRSPEAYAEGHIEGATNIGIKDLGKNFENLPKNKPILMVCYSGQNANQATGVLRVGGFDAYALVGGMNNGWLKAELPTVK